MFPGQKIHLSLKGLDQFNLSTYIIARISDRRSNVNKGAFSQTTDSDLFVNITVRPATKIKITKDLQIENENILIIINRLQAIYEVFVQYALTISIYIPSKMYFLK